MDQRSWITKIRSVISSRPVALAIIASAIAFLSFRVVLLEGRLTTSRLQQLSLASAALQDVAARHAKLTHAIAIRIEGELVMFVFVNANGEIATYPTGDCQAACQNAAKQAAAEDHLTEIRIHKTTQELHTQPI